MNRREWEAQVFNSMLNPNARLVGLVVGSFGNWNDDRTVWPSVTAVADMAGMHRDTAAKYINAFVEQGWLKLVKVREKNVKEYELCKPVAYPAGILTDPLRRNQHTKLPTQQATEEEGSCLTSRGQLPNEQVPVAYPAGINIKEPTIEPKEEEELKETLPSSSPSTGPKGPVSPTTELLLTWKKQYLDDWLVSEPFTNQQKEKAVACFLNEEWAPRESEYNRAHYAVNEAYGKPYQEKENKSW